MNIYFPTNKNQTFIYNLPMNSTVKNYIFKYHHCYFTCVSRALILLRLYAIFKNFQCWVPSYSKCIANAFSIFCAVHLFRFKIVVSIGDDKKQSVYVKVQAENTTNQRVICQKLSNIYIIYCKTSKFGGYLIQHFFTYTILAAI